MTRQGCFEHLPLENDSVSLAVTCGAFRSEQGRGGEEGLAELQRVVRSDGLLVIIWPDSADYGWLAEHGFHSVGFPVNEDAVVQFRSLESAWRCAQLFYASNVRLYAYLREQQQAAVPFSLLGLQQPSDYCWLSVQKECREE